MAGYIVWVKDNGGRIWPQKWYGLLTDVKNNVKPHIQIDEIKSDEEALPLDMLVRLYPYRGELPISDK